jgi:Family of unknown function (DUF6208)
MSMSSLCTIPLASASFAFFHTTKCLLHLLRRARDRRQDVLDWHTLSDVLARPLTLPYLMVTGPRWNPHALISRVGPFQLESGLRIKVETMHQSAQTWTLVINRAAHLRPIAVIDARKVGEDAAWYEQRLPPGRYVIVLRYYEWSAVPELPEIAIDDQREIPQRAVSAGENDYLGRLRNKEGAFYACLHYYMLEMFRLRPYLPAAFVRREYLPVGNPETAFSYGDLRPGQCIEIASQRGIPEGHRLYLTIYNRCSFPVSWSEVRSLPYRTSPAEGTGSYLWRLHSMHTWEGTPVWPEHLKVTLQGPQRTRYPLD